MTLPDPAAPSPTPRPCIVGVGTAALDPLLDLLRQVTRQDLSFVVCFEGDLPPSGFQALAGAAPGLSPERVSEATEPLAGRVYVGPRDRRLVLRDGRLHLLPRDGPAQKLPVDAFFRSLADDRGPEAIGIVLAGATSDGTLGLQAIKAADGVALVLDPQATAVDQDRMSRSALELTRADLCGTAEQLGQELMRLLAHPYLDRSAPRPALPAAEGAVARILALLRTSFGHDLTHYKQGTTLRRIERRMALRKVERLEDYVRLLQSSPHELGALHRDLLIGVTSFFRDGEPFDALKALVFPQLLAQRRQDAPLRVWVPGCSTGEEAYSIAIALLELLGDRAPEHRIQVFGTDVDDDAIQRARRAVYPENIALDVSAERLHRFFVKKDGHHQVARRVRDMLVFATQDVTRDPPYSHLDLVSCRNLMIYLQPVLQRKVLRIFHYALNPGGYLLLGTSESVGESTDLFSLVDRRNKLYARRGAVPTPAAFDVHVSEVTGRTLDVRGRAEPREAKAPATVQQVADRKVLDRFAPPGVVVNQDLDVLQFRGRTGPYLDPTPGAATLNVLKLARPEVAIELRGAIQRAQRDGVAASATGVSIREGDGPPRVIDIEVTPIDVTDPGGPCLLILFVAADARDRAEAAAPAAPPERGVPELEHELLTTRQYLQTTIEELETANEELQSANEELQSANEELQSTNEELETSKEELQSTNEELTTVNDELQTRMEELSLSNDDLHNVLIAIDTPLIIVGMDLRIRRFTTAAERLLNLAPGDVGRPVGHLRSFVNVPDLERIVSSVVERVTPRVLEARGTDDRWYELRLAPYKTTDHTIKGVLLTVADDERLRRRAISGPEPLADALVGELPQPALLVDPTQRVTWANRAFLRRYLQSERETVGRLVTNLGGAWSDPRLRVALERAALEGTPFQGLQLTDPADPAQAALLVSGSRVQASHGTAGVGASVVLVVTQETRG